MKNIIDIQTPEFVRVPFETAGIGVRGIAKIIDWLLIAVAYIPMGMIVYVFYGISTSYETSSEPTNAYSYFTALFIILLTVIPILYFTLFEYGMKGQTFGKKIVKIRVLQDDGRNPKLISIFLRNVLQLVDILPSFYLLGTLSIFINKEEKRLGDLVAGTIVIQERKEEQREIHFQYATLALSKKEIEILEKLEQTSAEQYLVLESFLLRRNHLDVYHRAEISRNFIQLWWPNIKTEKNKEEVFLEKQYLFLRQQFYPAKYPIIFPSAQQINVSSS
ncbi:RDD family protein [Hazenella sp. IB182357]|uniref:RDD family protein n=1 Tax=Polycladospora coralii TaxID=2771432 RepID=A0A926NA98_9BACL|nr:RDD family protein [Polycladospora coralii]MBD1371510.1 RDD family protein [Polycladospora coralii]MBS7528976.1 RDD family protein [Polycladospora coralii]